MSESNNGGPAFPVEPHGQFGPADGMTLRDYFAGQALAGICSIPIGFETWSDRQVAGWSYSQADAMIEAREKPPEIDE